MNDLDIARERIDEARSALFDLASHPSHIEDRLAALSRLAEVQDMVAAAAAAVDTSAGILFTDAVTVAEVLKALNAGLAHLLDEGGFSAAAGLDQSTPWDEALGGYRWLAVFPVTGGGEGHHVHVHAVSGPVRDNRCSDR